MASGTPLARERAVASGGDRRDGPHGARWRGRDACVEAGRGVLRPLELLRRAPRRRCDTLPTRLPARAPDGFIGASDAQLQTAPNNPARLPGHPPCRRHRRDPLATRRMPVTENRGNSGAARATAPWWARPARPHRLPRAHEAKPLDRHLAGEGVSRAARARARRHRSTGRQVNEYAPAHAGGGGNRARRCAQTRRQHNREFAAASAGGDRVPRGPGMTPTPKRVATETETESEDGDDAW